MEAEIIAVGTELLLGDIVNTNAQFISKELAALGINVYFQTVVGDNEKRVLAAYEAAFSRAELIITTGGLGPTDDDLTKEAAAKYFNRKQYLDEKILDGIKAFFASINAKMTPNNEKQALIPEGSIILPNDKGTAPGIIIEDNGKTIILLPGPPVEAKHMFYNYVIPYLQKKSNSVFVSRVLRLCGIGESSAEEAIKDLIKAQSNPSIAPYAKLGEMNFRITAKAENKEEAEDLIKTVADEIYNRLSRYIYAEGETTLAQAVVNTMMEKKVSIGIAESCTGGMLTTALTDVPGVSEILLEGAVTYSNEAKVKRLGVNPETLEQFGAVSAETAKEMAYGIAKTSGAKMGISITGIAGPGGGTDEKPVGLVYIGVHYNGENSVKKINLTGDRNRIRKTTVMYALDFVRSVLLGID